MRTAERPSDERRRWSVIAALCGLMVPVLIILGHDVISAVAGEAPARGTPAQEALEHALESDVARFYIGGFIGSCLAGLAMLVFVSYATDLIRRANVAGWLADAALGAGIVAVFLQLLTMVIVFATVRWAAELDPPIVSVLYVELAQTWTLTFLPFAAFMAILSGVSLARNLIARWVAWLGLALAPLVLAGQLAHFTADREVGVAFVPIALTWIVWLGAASMSLALRAHGTWPRRREKSG